MKPVIKIDGDFRMIYRASITDGKRAVTRGVTDAGVFLQNDWRAQVQGSGLGPNLARTIRRQTYPKTGTSLRAAALVWSKASKIVDAFDRGVTIRSSDGFYLAVPLPAAGAKGLGRKRITPGGWEARTGRRLTFVYRKGRHPLLVDTGDVVKINYMNRKGEHKRRGRGRKNVTIPIFVLVPQVKMPRKLNLASSAAQAQALLPTMIVANWKDVA